MLSKIQLWKDSFIIILQRWEWQEYTKQLVLYIAWFVMRRFNLPPQYQYWPGKVQTDALVCIRMNCIFSQEFLTCIVFPKYPPSMWKLDAALFGPEWGGLGIDARMVQGCLSEWVLMKISVFWPQTDVACTALWMSKILEGKYQSCLKLLFTDEYLHLLAPPALRMISNPGERHGVVSLSRIP
jgi:hypothetical protein